MLWREGDTGVESETRVIGEGCTSVTQEIKRRNLEVLDDCQNEETIITKLSLGGGVLGNGE